MSTLDIFTEVSPRQFVNQSAALCQLIGNILKSAGEQDLTSPIVFHAFRTLTNMTSVAEQNQDVGIVYLQVLLFLLTKSLH